MNKISKTMYERYLNNILTSRDIKQDCRPHKVKNIGTWIRKNNPDRFLAGYEEFIKLKSLEDYNNLI